MVYLVINTHQQRWWFNCRNISPVAPIEPCSFKMTRITENRLQTNNHLNSVIHLGSVANSSQMHGYGLLEVVGEVQENSCRHSENRETPHRKTRGLEWNPQPFCFPLLPVMANTAGCRRATPTALIWVSGSSEVGQRPQ